VLSHQQADQSYHLGSESYEVCPVLGCSADPLVLWNIRTVEVEMKVRNLLRRHHSVIMGAGDHPEEKDKKKHSRMLRYRMPAEWYQMLM